MFDPLQIAAETVSDALPTIAVSADTLAALSQDMSNDEADAALAAYAVGDAVAPLELAAALAVRGVLQIAA